MQWEPLLLLILLLALAEKIFVISVGLLLVDSAENYTLGEGEVLSLPKIHNVKDVFLSSE